MGKLSSHTALKVEERWSQGNNEAIGNDQKSKSKMCWIWFVFSLNTSPKTSQVPHSCQDRQINILGKKSDKSWSVHERGLLQRLHFNQVISLWQVDLSVSSQDCFNIFTCVYQSWIPVSLQTMQPLMYVHMFGYRFPPTLRTSERSPPQQQLQQGHRHTTKDHPTHLQCHVGNGKLKRVNAWKYTTAPSHLFLSLLSAPFFHTGTCVLRGNGIYAAMYLRSFEECFSTTPNALWGCWVWLSFLLVHLQLYWYHRKDLSQQTRQMCGQHEWAWSRSSV